MIEDPDKPKTFICSKCQKAYSDSRRLHAHSLSCGKPKKEKTIVPAEACAEEPAEVKPSRRSSSLSNDIKWMYKQMGGRDTLLAQATADPKFYKSCMELMLKSEQRVEEIKSGHKEMPKGSTIFVIKGLHEQGVTDLLETQDAVVRQFRASVMPEKDEFIEEVFEEKEEEE